MSQKHYDAVKARLELDPALTGVVFDTARLGADGGLSRETYVVLFGGGPEDVDDNRLSKGQDPLSDAEYVYVARTVAATADGAREASDHVFAQLAGARLVVEGRRCDPIRLSHSDPVEFDDSVKPPLAFIDQEYSLYSRRG